MDLGSDQATISSESTLKGRLRARRVGDDGESRELKISGVAVSRLRKIRNYNSMTPVITVQMWKELGPVRSTAAVLLMLR
jgi:hypothetical protein